jgi:hypothetical protein
MSAFPGTLSGGTATPEIQFPTQFSLTSNQIQGIREWLAIIVRYSQFRKKKVSPRLTFTFHASGNIEITIPQTNLKFTIAPGDEFRENPYKD